MKNKFIFVLLILSSASVWAAESVELTVYNQDFALVKQVLSRSLTQGESEMQIEGVAAQMDPTSVHIQSLTAPLDFRVLEQNFEYDLLNYGTLLEKYIGKDVEIQRLNDEGKTFIEKGKLLTTGYQMQAYNSGGFIGGGYQYSAVGSPMIEIDGKIHTAVEGHLVLPELPKDFVLKPALVWQIENKKAGAHDLQLSYLTSGIKWIADYVATVDAKDERLNIIGWVTLDNRSGTVYENAKLKLVAGEVNRIRQQPAYEMKAMRVNMMADAAGMAPQFSEESFFEYHLYTLQRPATVKNNEMKQIEMLSAQDVPVKKNYRTENGGKVKVTLELINNQTNNMGMPLPKGRVRIYKKDAQGSQQFIGEDQIEHTPKDEKVKLTMGEAFDLVVERNQTNVNQIQPGRIWEETWEIKLRNRKEENVRIVVAENLYGGREWKITKKSHNFEKKNAQLIEAVIEVPKGKEVVFSYTVKYSA